MRRNCIFVLVLTLCVATVLFTCCGHTHSYESTVTPPTCTEQGYTTYTCGCGDSYVDNYVNATGHSYEQTYTYDDNQHWYKTTCGHDDAVAKSDHTFDSNFICTQCGFDASFRLLSFTKISAKEEYAVTDCNVSATKITIPSTYMGLPVTEIGDDAFHHCSNLASVTIPDGITSIGVNAFMDCSSLASVTIPDSVTSIGSYGFRDCSSLTSITIPCNVTSIGYYAFENCYELVEVNNLSKLNVTKGGTDCGYVGRYALDVKTSGPSSIVNKDGYLFYTYDNTNYLLGYVGTDTKLTLPTDYNGQSYEIYQYAFDNRSNLTSVTIGNGVTSVGSYSFRDCSSITHIEIPSNVTSIGVDAFRYCYKLGEVCNLSKLDITKGSTDYGYVGYYALNVYTPQSGESKVSNIGDFLMYKDGDTYYLVGYFGNDAELVLPTTDYSYEIFDYAFSGCNNITSVTIPDGVTAIDACAFRECSNLTSVTIPCSVTLIGGDAFYGCNSLTKVNYTGDINSWAQIDFGRYYNNPLLYAHNLYINDKLVTEANITTATKISDYAFRDCTSLTSVTIGNSVTSIGEYAFTGCTNLTSVTISDGVTSIGNDVFSYCSSLTDVTIGNDVTAIGISVFFNCTNLASVVFTDTSTWYKVNPLSEQQNGTQTDVTSPSDNATYFKSTYYNYYWYKL